MLISKAIHLRFALSRVAGAVNDYHSPYQTATAPAIYHFWAVPSHKRGHDIWQREIQVRNTREPLRTTAAGQEIKTYVSLFNS